MLSWAVAAVLSDDALHGVVDRFAGVGELLQSRRHVVAHVDQPAPVGLPPAGLVEVGDRRSADGPAWSHR
jgi:hypothetical protein